MNVRKNLTGLLKVILLLIFTGYVGVLSLCTHVHIVDGVAVVHSHPFKKTGQGQPFHTHSQTAFQLIQAVTSFHVTANVVLHFLCEPFLPELFTLADHLLFCGNLSEVIGISLLRAPPVFA